MVRWGQAGIVALVLLCLLVGTSLLDMDFTKPHAGRIVKSVTMEAMTSDTSRPQSACELYQPKPMEMEKYCNSLSQKSCAAIGCCVYLSDGSCSFVE